jgi:hypothetical protein
MQATFQKRMWGLKICPALSPLQMEFQKRPAEKIEDDADVDVDVDVDVEEEEEEEEEGGRGGI